MKLCRQGDRKDLGGFGEGEKHGQKYGKKFQLKKRENSLKCFSQCWLHCKYPETTLYKYPETTLEGLLRALKQVSKRCPRTSL